MHLRAGRVARVQLILDGTDSNTAGIAANYAAKIVTNLSQTILVMLITLMLTSMAAVQEKEIGTIEQIMVTPIRQWEFILGKSVPFALIGFADVALVSLVGVLWFEVPIRGSLALLFGATTLYLMTTLGIGLFISTVSSTQQQAMMSAFFFYFPAVLLSGFMFPIANMPKPIQWLASKRFHKTLA